MISRLCLKNFKGFKEFIIEFEMISLLVGANNSGKTTLFHALQTFFWCIDRTANINNGQVKFGKTQIPEIGAFPYFYAKDIFYHQKKEMVGNPEESKLLVNLTLILNLDLIFILLLVEI